MNLGPIIGAALVTVEVGTIHCEARILSGGTKYRYSPEVVS